MDNATQKLRTEAGSIKINSVIISNDKHSVDVSSIVMKINLYEDLYSPFMTGKLVMKDATGVLESLPIVGEEIVVMDLETPGMEDNPAGRKLFHFHLYKVSDKENVAMKTVIYTAQLISIEGFTDLNDRISRTFRGTISDTVTSLLGDAGLKTSKAVVVETTTNKHVHTSNFWSPTQNIYYLASKASNDGNNPNFVFFECSEGFVFASMDSLYKSKPVQFFSTGQGMRQQKEVESLDAEYKKVLDVSTPVLFDYIQRHNLGMYGASMYYYDLELKRLNYIVRVATADFPKVQLNEVNVISDTVQFNPKSIIRGDIVNRHLYNDTVLPQMDNKIRRGSLLKQSDGIQTNISVFGRMDYTIGRVVELESYTNRSIDGKDEKVLDKLLSGNYLITSLCHEITHERHTCNMELSKDSYIS